ncbi:penicillin-binding protein 2 [candidate division TM6 bacterium RIFCSPHIGHO2_12_FULL_38_8]|nr:MAG: penicillin-binding protein 2 [candidate division TM6 bacterium RIFCSPHIGHO2_12_FULL_38_8]
MIIHNKIYNQKLNTIIWAVLFYFAIIGFRLIHLQIIQHKRLKNCSEKNFLRFKTVPAQRGNILDCHGIALATNQPVTQLLWKGSGLLHVSPEQAQALEKIEKILAIDLIEQQSKIKRAEKFCLELILAESISSDQLYQIAEQCSDIENIVFNTKFERFYPYRALASHILGYLGDIQVCAQGKMGLEKLFEETLRGDHGLTMQSMNSFGTLLKSEELKAGSAGQDLHTSIDLQLQLMVEKAMEEQGEGSCILMDPKTGLIKALVSKPNFDPSIFAKKLSTEQWQELQDKKALINRAFNATYPPASIFKLVTIAAALEEKLVSPNAHFTCEGFTVFKDRKYYCSKKTGHGHINMHEVLAFSCNIPFFELAKRLHIYTLAHYAYEFGLGSKTNVPFSEQHGLIPTNEWKMLHKGERWWTGETLSAAIGQSFLLVTPIQIACMIGSIFHGYLVTPHIIVDSEVEKRPIQINAHTRHFLQECMRQATIHGTAQRINKIGNLTIFAKTGTAQTKTRPNNQDPGDEIVEHKDKEHAWFVSYFYTDSTQPLVMVMLLEHVGKSTYATGVARKFFLDYMRWSKNNS